MDSSAFYFALFWVALLIFGVLYSSRKVAASLEKAEEKKPGLLADMTYYTAKWIMIFSLLGFLIPWLLMSWPPRWMERRDQRKEVFKRVEGAGGWSNLVSDSHVFLATNSYPGPSISPRYDTNIALPTAVAALKCREIEVYKWQGVDTLLLHIYGYHSTGGRGQANYWLYIVQEDADTKAMEHLRLRVGERRTIHQITTGVFEVY